MNDLKLRHLVKREMSGDKEADGFHLSIHRSIQLSILHGLCRDPQQRHLVFQQSFDAVEQQMPEESRIQVSQPEHHGRYEMYVPQILSLHAHSLWPHPPISLPLAFARRVKDCGTFMWHNRQHIEGEKALKTAKDILSQLNFEDMDPIYGDINGTLGTMLDMIGVTRRAESKRLKQHVIKVRERERASTPSERRTREDEIRLYNAYASAIFYQLDEDAAGVIQTMKECHEHYSLWGTEEEYPFEYAKYYNHTGLAYMHLGDTEKGIWFSKRACELQVAHGGSNAPMSLLYYFVLGNQYYMHGDIRASLDLNERILENRRQVCGATNPATLESYSMTGALLLLDHQAKKAKYVLDSR